MIRRPELKEYLKGRQQNYAAARVLLPRALESLKLERDHSQEYIAAVLETLSPFLPSEVGVEAYIVDDCDVAETEAIDDGVQLIVVNRHFLAFLRNFAEIISRGIQLGKDGSAIVSYHVDDDEKALFGRGIGEYLEFGTPLTFPLGSEEGLGPEIAVSAIEFVLMHEIVHRIEMDSGDYDLDLTGFQDFCRLRGREYRCDRKAVALILERRKHLDMPEMAFLGAVCALMAVSWVEQFTPGHIPESWHHPGSDSRVLRVHLEEPLFWRAIGLDGLPNGLTGAALRRAFRFMAALEEDPKLIVSPLNHLIHRCISSGTPDHNLFEARIGEVFTRGRVEHVSRSLGAMWGSSERMAVEERAGKYEFPQGQLACALFARMHWRLQTSSAAARAIADEILRAKEHRLNSLEL